MLGGVEPRGEVDVVPGAGPGALVEEVGFGGHEAAVEQPHLGDELGVGEPARPRRSEPEHSLGTHHRVGHGPAREERPVVVAVELAGVGVEDVQGAVEHGLVEAVEDVGRRQFAPHPVHPPAHVGCQGGEGALDAAPDGLVAVVHVVGGGRRDDGCVVLFDEGRELGSQALRGVGEVAVEVEVERWVEEDGGEAGPGRRLFSLGAAALPLTLETQAGDEAHHGPPPVLQVEQRTRGSPPPRRRGAGRRGGWWAPRTGRLGPTNAGGAGDEGVRDQATGRSVRVETRAVQPPPRRATFGD